MINPTRKHRFIQRSLLELLGFFRNALYSEVYAAQNGWSQKLDPRFKIVILSLLLLSILTTHHLLFLILLYTLCLILVMGSKISLGFFLKRTWLFIPLFSLFIALPAVFHFFTPGKILWSFPGTGSALAITQPGVFSAAFFLCRVVTSLSFVILLSLTTPHTQILRALRSFKIPSIFVLTLGMCYRYLFLFLQLIENTYLAICSRIGGTVCFKTGQMLAASNMAHLWQRSFHLNNQVYQAMLSRGFQGEPVLLEEFHSTRFDWLFLGLALALFITTVYFAH